MRRIPLAVMATAGTAALAAAGCGGSAVAMAPTGGAASTAPTVSVKSSSSLGRILVDGKGRTLYHFHKDTSSKSTCSGACAAAWPPFTVTTTPKAAGGASKSAIKTTKRSNGKRQVTYKGHPLYRFSGDSSPGQTKGQGVNAFGGKWTAVTPAGAAAKVKSGGGGSGGSNPYPGY